MQQRYILRGFLACLVTAVWWGCNENTGVEQGGDQVPPNVSVSLADTLVNINDGLQFTVSGSDNISLLTIGWSVTGAVTKDTLISFTTTTTSFSESFSITEGFTGGSFEIVATATDGAGNEAEPDTATATVFDDRPPEQSIIFPTDGAQFAAGEIIPLVALVQDPSGVAQMVGDLFVRDQFGRKVVLATDTINLATPYPGSVEDTLMVQVPANLAPGFYELGTVATDGATPQRSGDGPSITIRIIDTSLPTATFVQPDPAGPLQAVRVGDSVRVRVQLNDTQGLSQVTLDGVAFRGSATLGTDTTVQRFEPKVAQLHGVTDTLVIRDLNVVEPVDQTPERAWLRAVVQDTEGNVDTAMVEIDLTAGPKLTITTPADSSQVAAGFNLAIEILAEGNLIAQVGYLTTGALSASDTTFFPIGSQPDTTLESFVLNIPAGTSPGFFTLFPVGKDSAGNLGTGQPITVEIVAGGGPSDTEPPLVVNELELRVEVDDEILVKGTDLGGVSWLGYWVFAINGTSRVGGDSVSFSGTNTNEDVTFAMRLDTIVSTFPTQLIIRTFGIDAAGNRGAQSFDGVTAIPPVGKRDTITVVAGRTKLLPDGGLVADGIVNRNLGTAGEVYLTNWALDQLEVFDIATRTFGTAIPIGSRPWGIALWPSDTLGANTNRVMVANSGGTNISVVDVAGRTETRRHALPNFIIETVETEIDPDDGRIVEKVERFEFSDRPQFIGATCRPTDGLTTCAADSIYAVYSTTPTAGQSLPFPNRGSLRWENLTACDTGLGKDCFGADGVLRSGDEPDSAQSHFFWEHATVPPSSEADTLRVFAERGGVFETLLFAQQGITVDLQSLSFRDTTFVRNSGNFTHAFMGEGGSIGQGFARVLAYDGNVPLRQVSTTLLEIDTTITDVGPPPVFTIDTVAVVYGPSWIDDGVSRGTEVSDFIGNTAIPVRSIGTNFNGQTNLVRADSIYVLDDRLRLTGLVPAGGVNYGMDLNFDHDFLAGAGGTAGTDGGSGDPDDRMLFAATDNPEVVVFDTWFYGEVASIPIRDPIIGPLRVAELPTGEQFLVGVTARGVVTVKLPPVTNIFPAPPRY